jgi:SAM-dependent methyltransferase
VSDFSVSNYYSTAYDKILNSGRIGKLSSFVHWYTEKSVPKESYGVVLEVGAGRGQHKFAVKNEFGKYIESDIRIEQDSSIPLPFGDSRDSKLMRLKLDAQDLKSIPDSSVDRLIATCVLVHLPDPEMALREWRRVLKPSGVASIFIPCEPGMFLRLFRRFSTIPKSRKMGIDHASVHYREHRNMWIFCKLLIDEVFECDQIKVKKFPFPFFTWNFRLFDLVIVTKQVE